MNESKPQSDSDKAALGTLEKKLHLVRDHVTAVAKGYKTGYYLYGTGGMGKSYTVLRHLEGHEVPYQLFNSRMTAKGLFLALQRAPDAIHVLEDMERLTKDPDAQGVLRSALWRSRATTASSPGPPPPTAHSDSCSAAASSSSATARWLTCRNCGRWRRGSKYIASKSPTPNWRP